MKNLLDVDMSRFRGVESTLALFASGKVTLEGCVAHHASCRAREKLSQDQEEFYPCS